MLWRTIWHSPHLFVRVIRPVSTVYLASTLLPDICFDILSDTLSHVLIFYVTYLLTFYLWHSPWHSLTFIWHSIWHSVWHYLAFSLHLFWAYSVGSPYCSGSVGPRSRACKLAIAGPAKLSWPLPDGEIWWGGCGRMRVCARSSQGCFVKTSRHSPGRWEKVCLFGWLTITFFGCVRQHLHEQAFLSFFIYIPGPNEVMCLFRNLMLQLFPIPAKLVTNQQN